MTTSPPRLPAHDVVFWDRVATSGWYLHPLASEELRRFERHFPGHRGKRAIDVGCGTGEFTRHLYAAGLDVTGIDWSPAMIALARQATSCPLPYVVHDLALSDPPGLTPRSVDLVVCRQTLSLLDDPADLLYRIRTHWLRPGGHLYLSEVRATDYEARTLRGGMTDQQLDRLGDGWAHAVRYDLTSQRVACVILRDTAA
ncbi:bifunctional 2-polyprenyl-6-hydroxyphenol methylase/3-demethylubiquinol 3-O-methyltransferase UbiG [Streptomyces sp. TLI_146]|uniref:class I SAM-dependent methyltransferase n=1 Tax=Streptomyces sp. TLI_146 TaxID=1938858 RepID=UPI000C6FDB62|nr:class I SAM-dependent methyltransferase [Streptomyces sp. TLI_146]PKV84220.1 methyltransferase family protein [Streptomyces sp. TLI_146]